MELPCRDVGLGQLSCFSVLDGTKGYVRVSGLIIYMVGFKSRWDVLGSVPVVWTGPSPSPCRMHPEILSPMGSPREVGHGREMGTLKEVGTWPVTSC